MNLLGKQSKGTLTDFKDPFSKNKIEGISIFIRKGLFDSKIRHTAHIDFKNGNTSGTQNIAADDFPELINKIDEFIENL